MPHLRELDDLFEVVAIADASAETLELVGDHYGIAKRAPSLDELLRERLDAVMILTPGSHGDACVAAANAGLHVFVEKPLCYTLREADTIAAAVERAATTLQVGYMKRYDPAYRRAIPLVKALDDLRFVQITTIHPASELFWEHHPIRRRRDEPATHRYEPAPYPAGPTESELSLLREILPGDHTSETLSAAKTMLTSLCHDVNALRGLLGEPTAVLSCDAWQRGGCITTVLMYGEKVRCVYTFAYVPNLRDYREELAFYGGDGRVRLVFPSPFLRNMPTDLFVERVDEGAANETRSIVSYEEAFKEELRAFHRNITTGTRPETDVADSRADIDLLTKMARLAAAKR